MKKTLLFMFVLLLATSGGWAQVNDRFTADAWLPVYDLEVTQSKTTALVFPEEVISADVGSIGLLVEKFEKAKNILRVKANRTNFDETSLTVVTGDGKVWTFVVHYTNSPDYLSVDLRSAKPLPVASLSKAQSSLVPLPVTDDDSDPVEAAQLSEPAMLEGGELNPATIKALVEQSSEASRHIRDLGINGHRLNFTLRNIFVRNNVMFFQLNVRNRSQIDYEVSVINLLVRDQQRSKRASQQEIAYEPIHSDLGKEVIKGKEQLTFTYALPKITIPDNKVLWVQLYEKGGGRHLEFPVMSRDINRAKSF